MDTVVVVARIVLAAVFIVAGIGKLLDLEGSRRAVRDFGVPDGIADPVGLLLPLAELGAAVALIFVPSGRWGAVAALLLLLGFIGGIANALRQGMAPDCHCFGQIHSEPAGRGTLIRNGILAAVAAIVVIAGPRVAIDTWVNARSAAELAAIGLGMAAAVFAVLWLQLRSEVHALRSEITTARRIAMTAPPGLPVGSIAPEFELESLEGGAVSLSSLRNGKPVLLLFASIGCSSCVELFPSVRRWQQTLQERLEIAIISAGTAKDNAPLSAEYGLKKVLLAQGGEMLEAYRVRATPTAMLIGADGKIASAPAESLFAVEPLVRSVLRSNGSEALPQGSVV